MQPSLIQITPKRPSASLLDKIKQAPIAPPFFLAAMINGIIGITYFGVHLWLMRTGQIPIAASYATMRELHAAVQLFLFFGLFILGFILQAHPKLLQLKQESSRYFLLAIPCTLVGAFMLLIEPLRIWAQLLLSLPFALTAIMLLHRLWQASFPTAVGIGVFLIEGLVGLAIGPWVSSYNNWSMLMLFWVGIGAPIFAASQQFIRGFLGGEMLTLRGALVVHTLYAASVLAGIGSPSQILFPLLAITTIVAHSALTESWRAISRIPIEPLALAFCVAGGWSIIGASMLLGAPENADGALHAWATGWALTLVVAIVPRIISFLSGTELIPPRRLTLLIALLQVVPIGRSLPATLPPSFSWVVSIVATLVYGYWFFYVVKGISRVLRKQLQLSRGEIMVHC